MDFNSSVTNSTGNDSAVAGEDGGRPFAYLYQNLCTYYLIWYLPLTIIIGSMGTLISLFFLFCSKMFQSNMLIWLSSICVGDFLILMLEGVWILLKVWFKYDIRDQNDIICVLHKSGSNYAFYWSAYMQCALSVQRAYLVFRPLHARAHGGLSKRHVLVWIIISVVIFIPMCPYVIYWRVINDDCDPTNRDVFYITTLSDLIVWGIIPLLGMTVATCVICLNMAKVGKKFAKRHSVVEPRDGRKFTLTVQVENMETPEKKDSTRRLPRKSVAVVDISGSKSTSAMQTLSTRLVDPAGTAIYDEGPPLVRYTKSSVVTRQKSVESHRHNAPDNFGHVTRLLVCMNFAYMTSTFPLLSYLMYRNFSGVTVDPDVHRFLYYMCRSFCFLNSCTNWIFYCVVGKQFRDEAVQILRMCCGRKRKRSFRNVSSHSQKGLNAGNILATPLVSQQTTPVKNAKAVNLVDIQKAMSQIPLR